MRDMLVFGHHGQLASELLPLLAARSPYRTRSIARSEIDLSRLAAGRDLVLSERPYLVANTAAYAASWFRFAEAIFASATRQGLLRPRLPPTTTDAYPTAARPRFSLLDCSALARDWGLSLTPWTAAFDETIGVVMRDLKDRHS
jgi:dTDP-4-dehydrorhamnose reductase